MDDMRNRGSWNEQSEIWLLLDSRNFGGIEAHVYELARALRRHGDPVRVVLIADYGSHPLIDKLNDVGIPVECLGGGPLGVARAFLRRPRLVHTHGYKAGILGRAAGRVLGVPVVSTFHAGEPGNGRLRIYNKLDGLSAFMAPSIAVSPSIAAGLTGSTTIIDNFVPVPPAMINSGSNKVVFVGRLSSEKGPDLFCALARRLPHLRFEACGDGPMRKELEDLFTDVVTFHGEVHNMAEMWKDYGLLCMPSRHEGLPMAALEAMSHGVPVAAFAVGGLPNLIDDGRNGWLAPPLDLDALAARVNEWSRISEEERIEYARRARETIVASYSPQVVLPRILDIYQRISGSGAAIGFIGETTG